MGQSLARPRYFSIEALNRLDEKDRDLFCTQYPMVGQGYVRRLDARDGRYGLSGEPRFGFFSVEGELLATYHDEPTLMVSARHQGFSQIHRVH